MSCSTTSLIAGTITTNTITIEDPYIFTETVPTTPPTLFSNSQKSRIRFETKPQQQTQQQQQKSLSTTLRGTSLQTTVNKDVPLYVKGRNYVAQTQATSFATAATTVAAPATNLNKITTTKPANLNPPTAVLGVLNTNNIKKYETKVSTKQPTLQQQRQQKHAQNLFASQNENIIEKQQLQQQPKLLSTTPPPLLLSHTPSLWQTPLLLECTATTPSSTVTAALPTTTTTNMSVKKESTPQIRLLPPPLQATSQPSTPPILTATALVTPTQPITLATTVEAATAINSNIAPLHLLMPTSATPLPPSNFHHTTLAQHLQKLQCLKKPKKVNTQFSSISDSTSIATTTTTSFAKPSNLLKVQDNVLANKQQQQQQQQQKHSANDLNEIPVNVIFRAANSATQNVSAAANQASIAANNDVLVNSIEHKKPINTTPNLVSCTKQPTTQQKQQSPQIKQLSTVKPRKIQKSSNANPQAVQQSFTATNTITTAAPVLNNSNALKITNSKKKATVKKRHQANIHLPHPKAQKRFRKSNFFPSLLNERERTALATLPDISLSTKAVAVVKMPFNEFSENFKTLSDENELPFCVQKHWFHIQQDQTYSVALNREERINEYKNTLRRQAMQLLATRSLQRLPFNIARKRLLCVDALLRKYRDHNKTSSTSKKQCEIDSCKNDALAMTTLCQQHMARNTKQSIFVLCSAKNVNCNNSQQTNCSNPVLNIQKQYAPPLCCSHLNQQQQQLQQQQQGLHNGKIFEPQINNNLKATRTNITKQTTLATTRKRKFSAVNENVRNNNAMLESNSVKAEDMLPLINRTNMQRKNSTTSLESIASNSHSSYGSSVKTTTIATTMPAQATLTATNMLSPPALAPLSYNSNTTVTTQPPNERQNRNFPAAVTPIDPFAEQEINKLVAQFAMAAAAKSTTTNITANHNNNISSGNNNNNFNNSFNFMNTNSNSNLTSSGVGSSSSLPSTDELLTQDMLSNCENSSAYASSSEDTGLGELSESELMAVSSIAENIEAAHAIANGFSNIVSVANGSGGNGSGNGSGGFNVDDVSPDEIPLGDARLLEENDLVNVFGTLPVNLNELYNAVVQQDEREEVERALEIAEKHLRSLQQTIGSDTDFLDDLLDVNDDMLVDTDDICSKMEIVSSALPPNDNLDGATLYLENAEKVLSQVAGFDNIGGVVGNNNSGSSVASNIHHANHHHQLATANITMPTNCAGNNGGNNNGVLDIRGLLQT